MSSFQPEFTFSAAATRVRFGPGIRHALGEEVERLGARRAVIVSTPGRRAGAEALASTLGERAAGVIATARMHTPVEVTEAAMEEFRRLDGDCLVAIGGGSASGLSKALALRTGLPQIVLPTTYSGSEATPTLGETRDGRKVSRRDPRVQAAVILYDAELIASLPVPVSVVSALNAMAHAAEGLYARERNPVSTLLALEGIRAMRRALPAVRANPADLDARGESLYGAWLCGVVLSQVGMALHHKLCHVLGGAFDTPHAETHAALLPYVIDFNSEATREELAPLTGILATNPEASSPGAALAEFAASVGAPRSLREIGLEHSALGHAADLAMQDAYWNPRPMRRSDILELLERAWAGETIGH